MLDPRRLRTELDVLKKGLARRGIDTSVLDRAAELDDRQRVAIGQRDEIRARVKAISKEVGEANRAGDTSAVEAKKQESRDLGEAESRFEAEAKAAGDELRHTLLRVPNNHYNDAPAGTNADAKDLLRIMHYHADADVHHQRG